MTDSERPDAAARWGASLGTRFCGVSGAASSSRKLAVRSTNGARSTIRSKSSRESRIEPAGRARESGWPASPDFRHVAQGVQKT